MSTAPPSSFARVERKLETAAVKGSVSRPYGFRIRTRGGAAAMAHCVARIETNSPLPTQRRCLTERPLFIVDPWVPGGPYPFPINGYYESLSFTLQILLSADCPFQEPRCKAHPPKFYSRVPPSHGPCQPRRRSENHFYKPSDRLEQGRGQSHSSLSRWRRSWPALRNRFRIRVRLSPQMIPFTTGD